MRKLLDSVIKDSMQRALDKVLPEYVDKIAFERLSQNKNRPLSRIGFQYAVFLFVLKEMPRVARSEVNQFAAEYLKDYGKHGYIFSPNSAEEVAREYVDCFGEHA